MKLLLDIILNSLTEGKAINTVKISLEGKSEEADYMIIASGNSTTQVSAISQRIMVDVKKKKNIIVRTEGLNNSDWVLLDCGDVIVHVFREEVRDFYQLEKMWMNGTNKEIALEN